MLCDLAVDHPDWTSEQLIAWFNLQYAFIKAYQTSKGLLADGLPGPKTLATLKPEDQTTERK